MLQPQELYHHIQSSCSSKEFLIAYSGGLDSHVLLHLMNAISQTTDIKIRALYVNHGLQKEADIWATHCQKTCQEMQISCDVVKLNLSLESGESVEALARNGRYQALQQSLQMDEVLLTAHHQNDQAETLLLQLFRGAGVDGLASMPKITGFGLGQQLRPLLDFSKDDLVAYANHYHLDYIDDPSNQDHRFDRNYLRHVVIPLIQERWLGINKVLARAADIQAETAQVLDNLAAEDLQEIRSTSHQENELSINALLLLSEPRQKLVLRYWIKQQGFLAPSSKKLLHLFKDVLHAKKDANPLLAWQGVQLRRFKNRLYIMPPLCDFDSSQVINWDMKNNLFIPALEIELQASEFNILLKAQNRQCDHTQITVRFRHGGETVFIDNKTGNLSLKKLLQDAQIPPWQRSRVPLIYLDDKLIHVCINPNLFTKEDK